MFTVFSVKMSGIVSLKYIRITIPKNRLTSGIGRC